MRGSSLRSTLRKKKKYVEGMITRHNKDRRTAMNDSGTRLVVLLLGAPEVLEGAEGSENGSTDPDGVLPLRRSNDLDLHARG